MNYQELTRPLNYTDRLYYWSALSCLVLAIGLLSMLGRSRSLEGINALIRPTTHETVVQVSPPLSASELAVEHRATELSQMLQRHWENPLLAFEQVNVAGVTILELQPDFSSGHITVHGESKDFNALAEFIRQLNATGLINHVQLMHEQGISRENVDTIEFQLIGEQIN